MGLNLNKFGQLFKHDEDKNLHIQKQAKARDKLTDLSSENQTTGPLQKMTWYNIQIGGTNIKFFETLYSDNAQKPHGE